MLTQTLVQLLTVTALLDGLHHDVLACHERQLGHDAGTDDLRVDDQPVGDVQQDVQDGVSSQEALGHRNALIGGVVQRALKPLGTGSDGGVQHVHHQVAAQRADALAAHGVALVGHSGGTDLVLLKRLLHLLEVRQQADVRRHLHGGLADACHGGQHIVVHLAAVGLAADRHDLGKVHLGADVGLDGLDLGGVAVEQLHKAGLGAGGALNAAQCQLGDLVVKLLQIHVQLVHPERGALADGGQLRGLAVGVGQAGHGLVLVGELGQICQHADDLLAHELQALAHDDDVGVVTDIAAGRAQMDDALCLGALQAVGVDVAHHVMADELLARNGVLIVDVVLVRLQLGNLLIGDGQALLLLGLSQRDPQPAPGAELVVVREDVLHLIRRIARRERRNIFVVLCHWVKSSQSFKLIVPV